jgi:hypothetical protein
MITLIGHRTKGRVMAYTAFAELDRALGNAREPLDPRNLTKARLRTL